MPSMPLSGVRISWLTVARKRDLASLAASARSRAAAAARSSQISSRSRSSLGLDARARPPSPRAAPDATAETRPPSARRGRRRRRQTRFGHGGIRRVRNAFDARVIRTATSEKSLNCRQSASSGRGVRLPVRAGAIGERFGQMAGGAPRPSRRDRRWCARASARGESRAPRARSVRPPRASAPAPAASGAAVSSIARDGRGGVGGDAGEPESLRSARPGARAPRRRARATSAEPSAGGGRMRSAAGHGRHLDLHDRCGRAADRTSAPDIARRSARWAARRQAKPGSSAWPQRHGFMAATSWKRAG